MPHAQGDVDRLGEGKAEKGVAIARSGQAPLVYYTYVTTICNIYIYMRITSYYKSVIHTHTLCTECVLVNMCSMFASWSSAAILLQDEDLKDDKSVHIAVPQQNPDHMAKMTSKKRTDRHILTGKMILLKSSQLM